MGKGLRDGGRGKGEGGRGRETLVRRVHEVKVKVENSPP
jgi:hypothetical protein